MHRQYLPYVEKTEVQEAVAEIMKLLKLILTAGWQERKEGMPNSLLIKAAQQRAVDMASRDYFSHTSPDGITPNEVVRGVGYFLPSWYPQKANNVESISIGANTPEDAITGWFDSPKHHDHLVGAGGFYGGQNAAGAGKAKAKDGRWIWVFITAPKAG